MVHCLVYSFLFLLILSPPTLTIKKFFNYFFDGLLLNHI